MDRPSSDGWSRILAGVGILLALGFAVMFLLENRQLRSRLDQLESTSVSADITPLAAKVDQLTASDQKFKEQWDAQLTAELHQFRERSGKLNAAVQDFQGQAEQLLEEQRSALEREVAQLSTTGAENADVRALVQAEFQALQRQTPAQPLRVAQNLMKVATNDEAHVAVIQNDTQQAIPVSRVTFRPRVGGQFEFDGEPLATGSTLADWRIRFVPVENTATQPGHHHHYERRFAQQRQVPAQGSIRIVLEIENPKHRGWGLEGVLVIGYEDGKELEVPDVRAVFVDTPSA